MKALAKRIAQGIWSRTASIRRPIARRIDDRVGRVVALAVRPTLDEAAAARARLAAIEHAGAVAREQQELLAGELDLTLNSLLRELARLRGQIEDLAWVLDARQADDDASRALPIEFAREHDRISA